MHTSEDLLYASSRSTRLQGRNHGVPDLPWLASARRFHRTRLRRRDVFGQPLGRLSSPDASPTLCENRDKSVSMVGRLSDAGVDVHGAASYRVKNVGAHVKDGVDDLAPPTPRMASPRMALGSTSTCPFMKPSVSPFSTARPTRAVGRVPAVSARPEARTYGSVGAPLPAGSPSNRLPATTA